MKRDLESPICEPHEVMREADEIIHLIRTLPDGEPLRNATATALANMANSGELTVWAGIDGFLRGVLSSGTLHPQYVDGVKAIQQLVAESYADVLARLRARWQEQGIEVPGAEQRNVH